MLLAALRWPILAATLFGAAPAEAGAEIDTTFGDNGMVLLPNAVTAALVTPEATVPWGGYWCGPQCFGPRERRMGRLQLDGSGDPSFLVTSPAEDAPVLALARQPDAKLLVVYRASSEVVVQRLLAGGGPDPTFAVFRLADTSVGASVAIQSDGRALVLAGSRVIRLLGGGSLDTTYGNNGIATLPSEPGFSYSSVASGLQLLPDDRAVVLRRVSGCADACQAKAHLSRLTSAGTPDPSLGGSGSVVLSRVAHDLAVYPDARTVLSGAGEVFRMLPDGTLDPSFGQGGVAAMLRPETVGRVMLEPDGSITAMGPGLVLLRWRADGSPEGRVRTLTPMGNPWVGGAPATVLLRLPDGRRVAAATYYWQGDLDIEALWSRFGPGSADPFADARLFAAHQYRDFLVREGDASGVAYWASRLDAGVLTRAQLMEHFFGSTEFQGVVAPIVRLYLATFLRPPDGSGLAHWTTQLRQSGTLTQVAQEFAISEEFNQRYGSLDDSAFVARVYLNVLAREPDSAGLQYWTGRLAGGMTRGELMAQFSESTEFRALTATEVFVSAIYAGALQRAPDASGYAYWTDRLEGGASGSELVAAFLGSAEYRNRFLP